MNDPTESKFAVLMRILRFPLTRLLLLGAIIFYLYISGHMFRGAMAHGPLADLVVSSLVAFVILTLTGLVILGLAARRGKIVPPFWMCGSKHPGSDT
jgi:hypothetical protein